MSTFVAIIRDDTGRGVRADRVEGWEPKHYSSKAVTRAHLAGGGSVDLYIDSRDFVQRLDRALTELDEVQP